jgi:sec-independent protein translocase protein TatC
MTGSAVYYYHDFFIRIVMDPLGSQKLIYLTPAGGFSFVFMVTFYITILAMLPFILYQIYAFIKPAIPKHTRHLSLAVGVVATLLMVAGATFGYLFAVPGGLNFLSNFASEYVTASITADSYLSFVLGYVLGIGILFELPLLLLFLHWIHPLTPKGLLNSERFVIVGAFISAAVLSPSPDALSQAIIAVPIILVYQLGVVAVLVSIKRSSRQEKRAPIRASPHIPAVQPLQPHRQITPHVVPSPIVTSAKVTASHMTQRRRTSVDGMLVVPSKPQAVVSPISRAAPVRPRSTLIVAPRSRVISDFRPIRNSIVDISR